MYQVIARKYRPQNFAELVGQEHVRTTLENAILQGRIAHGYIFSGQRGTGKTTVARILARCLNCVQGPTVNPCGACASCVEIAAGNSVDVIEILKIAKEGSAKVIAITSHDHTPLTDLADVKIFSYSKETRFRTEAMESRIVQLSIIDALFVSTAMINPQRALQEIRSTTNPLPYKVVSKRPRTGGDMEKGG